MSSLSGKRILLVEDEFIVAIMAADMLAELGATVVGPAESIDKGLALAETENIDAAVLDININGEFSYSIAEALRARHIPMVFATGYGEDAREARRGLILDKPYTRDMLAKALTRVLNACQRRETDQ